MSEKTMSNPFGLKFETIYPEVRDAFNEHFSVIHASYEMAMDAKENNGAYDSRSSYARCVYDDLGTPIKSPEQMMRIIKMGESLLEKGAPNPKNKDILDMYGFCKDGLSKAAQARGFPNFEIK